MEVELEVTQLLPSIPELAVAVFDRGVPNRERIVVTPKVAVEMAGYCLIIGVRNPGTEIFQPIPDRFFWFGTGIVTPKQRVFVYTGPGETRLTTVMEAPELEAVVLHWGHRKTLFADTSLSPLLIKIESMNIGSPLQMDLPQIAR